ncbi:hypothetical protein NC651_007702 [Populus alba x Populus x berolinensis]|nr:hypothetical protein NC651_007702 [Populus alba x Populus x berolinensis]
MRSLWNTSSEALENSGKFTALVSVKSSHVPREAYLNLSVIFMGTWFSEFIKIHALEAFPIPEGAHMMNFEAVDATDNAWRFCLSTRLTGAYPKPVLLRSSWHRFVEQKGLAPEDRVVFFTERDDMVRRYTVRAQRKVIMILMGQDIWVDVEDLPLYGL